MPRKVVMAAICVCNSTVTLSVSQEVAQKVIEQFRASGEYFRFLQR